MELNYLHDSLIIYLFDSCSKNNHLKRKSKVYEPYLTNSGVPRRWYDVLKLLLLKAY